MTTGILAHTRIRLDLQAPVARLVLRHPSLNVIDLEMMDELTQALAEIEKRSDISVVVLSGAGKSFSVGVDVAAHSPEKVAEMLAKFHGVIRTLVASRKVTIAAVHGYCLGGGAELAMVCDIVCTAASTSPSATAQLASPICAASAPVMFRPVRIKSAACFCPTNAASAVAATGG